jgi:serine/threonine-protein kinase
LRRRSITALGISLGLMALMGSLAYTSVVRPVRALVGAQRKLLQTSTINLVKGSPKGGDEIGELSAAFETIEQRIRDQEALGEVFLGRFQVVKVLGEGAMGSVFRGYDPKLQRWVALKTIRLGVGLPEAERKSLMSRLLKEAVTVAQFNHPNIVDIYDVEDTAQAAFIAMELVEGTSLEQRLQRPPHFGVEAVVPLGAQIARALEAAHARGIVHHDVKPANVLLGHNGAVKVTDFGIAELLSTLGNRKDGVWGTLGYLPPETLLDGSYDEKGDVFALGAVLYECLSGGRRAIAGADPREITARTRKPIPSIRTHCADLPESIEALVMEMLAPRPELRKRTMAEVAEVLEAMAAYNLWKWTAAYAKGNP